MKKNGFTLIEMMAVILIIALLTIAVVPSILKQVANEKKDGINKQTTKLIETAASLYISNHKSEFTNGGKIKISDLVAADLLDDSIIDPDNDNAVIDNTCITVKMENNEYEYIIEELDADATCD